MVKNVQDVAAISPCAGMSSGEYATFSSIKVTVWKHKLWQTYKTFATLLELRLYSLGSGQWGNGESTKLGKVVYNLYKTDPLYYQLICGPTG